MKTWTFPEYTSLEDAVKRLFEILETKEISDQDREFHPVTISSVRVHKTAELESLLPQMKKLAKIENNTHTNS